MKVLDPKWDKNKSLPLQWRYYHRDSWVLLVYQILKIFYLSRVNLRALSQAIKHLPNDIQSRHNNSKIPSSNVYSSSEIILLRWVSACYEYINPHINKDIINFSSDFADSSILTSVLISYFPKEEKNASKRKQQSNDLKIIPYSSIINILKDYGIFTHIKNLQVSPTSTPNAREMVLF